MTSASGRSIPPAPAATGQPAAAYSPAGLTPNTTYFWQVTARNDAGTTPGPVWSFTTGPAPATTLPAPWVDRDVGAVGAPGAASYNSGTFTVAGLGADVWNAADAFHAAYEPLTGDGALVARVASIQNVNAWTKAGIMIRDTLDPSSAYAFMLLSPGKGSAFQYRTSAGALAQHVGGAAVTAPYWVKVVRAGTTITGYESIDGAAWTAVGSATIPMGSTVEIGLAVSSHVAGTTASATFDHVQ